MLKDCRPNPDLNLNEFVDLVDIENCLSRLNATSGASGRKAAQAVVPKWGFLQMTGSSLSD